MWHFAVDTHRFSATLCNITPDSRLILLGYTAHTTTVSVLRFTGSTRLLVLGSTFPTQDAVRFLPPITAVIVLPPFRSYLLLRCAGLLPRTVGSAAV